MLNDANYIRKSVDLEFILNERKLLTEKEFKLTIPNGSYDSYIREFYKRRIYKFYEKVYNVQWFVNRYAQKSLLKDKILERYRFFLEKKESDFYILSADTIFPRRFNHLDKKYVLLDKVTEEYSEDDICKMLGSFKEIKKIEISQSGHGGLLDREVIVTLFPESDITYSVNEIKKLCDKRIMVHQFELCNDIRVKKSWIDINDKDVFYLKKIFSMLNSYYETNINYDCNDHDKLIYLLRHVFLYCYYCTRKFDTEIDMVRYCGDYHVRDVRVQRKIFDRKLRILTMDRNFDYLKDRSLDIELNKCVVQVSDAVFKCDLCHKTFEMDIYVKKHIKNKHSDMCLDIEQNIKNFNNFLDNIDIGLLIFLDGINNNSLPAFCVHEEEGNAVKYDLDRVFSGEILIKK